jgi:hypothetical protein
VALCRGDALQQVANDVLAAYNGAGHRGRQLVPAARWRARAAAGAAGASAPTWWPRPRHLAPCRWYRCGPAAGADGGGIADLLASVLFLVSAGLAVVVRLPMLEQAASDATARVMASSLIMVVDSNARLGSGGVETRHAAVDYDNAQPAAK